MKNGCNYIRIKCVVRGAAVSDTTATFCEYGMVFSLDVHHWLLSVSAECFYTASL